MKTKHLLPVASLLILTACQNLRDPAPGNALTELVSHKQFMLVARDYPEFVNDIARQIIQLDTQLSWANYHKMEAIRASKAKAAKAATP